MPPRFGVDLLGVGQKPDLNLLDGPAARTNGRFRLIEGRHEFPAGRRKVLQLPRFPCPGNREKCGPVSSVHQRVLAVKQLGAKYVGMIGEFRQHGKNQPTFWVRPPGSSQTLTGHERDDVRQVLVLLEQQPAARKGVENDFRWLCHECLLIKEELQTDAAQALGSARFSDG